jgi:hypothetical protein
MQKQPMNIDAKMAQLDRQLEEVSLFLSFCRFFMFVSQLERRQEMREIEQGRMGSFFKRSLEERRKDLKREKEIWSETSAKLLQHIDELKVRCCSVFLLCFMFLIYFVSVCQNNWVSNTQSIEAEILLREKQKFHATVQQLAPVW